MGTPALAPHSWLPQYTPDVPAPTPLWEITIPRRGRSDRVVACTADEHTAEKYAALKYTVTRLR